LNINNSIVSKNILVTGGTGFLGSFLVHSLLQNSYNLIVLKRSTSDTRRINDVFINYKKGSMKYYDIDINGLEAAFRDQHIDIIIHMACLYGRKKESISSIIESNIMFGIHLLEFAKMYNVDTFINTDTFFSQYSITKYKNYCLSKKHFYEWLIQSAENVKIVNMKLGHMYGPKDDKMKFIPWLINLFDQNEKEIELTDGIQERDFIYVTDVVSAYLKVLKHIDKIKNVNEFYIGSGEPTSLKYFIIELDKQYKYLHPDNTTKLIFGRVPLYENEPLHLNVDIKAILSLGWLPKVSISEGIKNILTQ
jgi:nucleoside-diphosphate-sugar epimerase